MNQSTFLWEEPPANPSASQDCEKDWLTRVATSCSPTAQLLADLAEDLPRNAMLKILRSLNSEERKHVNAVLAYEDDQVGAFMDFGMITIREDLTLKAIADYIRKLGKLPSHTDKLFVVDQQDVVKGVLPLQRLLTHPPHLIVEEVMVTDFVQFQVD